MELGLSNQHSTLESIRYDSSAGALESNGVNRIPVDTKDYDAPQVAIVSGPETHSSNIRWENVEGKARLVHSSQSRRLSLLWRTVIVAIVIAVIIGLAVGLGVGLGTKEKKPSGSVVTRPASTMTVFASPRPTSTSTPTLSQKQLLSNTSFAALHLQGGDRRLFFQEQSGIIRQAIYSASGKTWSTDSHYIVASDARNNTPIAALNNSEAWNAPGYGDYSGITVFYVLKNDTLACRQFQAGSWVGAYDSVDPGYYPDPSRYTVAKDTQHLAVGITAINDSQSVFILYESSSNNVSLLKLSHETLAPKYFEWKWTDLTGSLYDEAQKSNNQLNLTNQLSVPFAVVRYYEFDTFAILFASKQDGIYSKYSISAYINGSTIEVDQTPEYNSIDTITEDADLFSTEVAEKAGESTAFGTYTLWVNSSSLTNLNPGRFVVPYSPYPYKRLAGLDGITSTSYAVYHQLNATTFAEDVWHEDLGVWTSTEVSVDST